VSAGSSSSFIQSIDSVESTDSVGSTGRSNRSDLPPICTPSHLEKVLLFCMEFFLLVFQPLLVNSLASIVSSTTVQFAGDHF